MFLSLWRKKTGGCWWEAKRLVPQRPSQEEVLVEVVRHRRRCWDAEETEAAMMVAAPYFLRCGVVPGPCLARLLWDGCGATTIRAL